jgi:hypothetical protein
VFALRTLEIVGSGADRIKAICGHGQDQTIRKLHREMMGAIPLSSHNWLYQTTHKLLSSIPDHIQEEFKALAEAVGVPATGIATLNFLDELARLADLGRYVNPMACSSLGVFHPSEQLAIVGRNLDYGLLLPELRAESYRYHHRNHGHGYDYISWSWPGFVGVVTGLNSQGLWLATHTARSLHQSDQGVPNGILYRMIMENACGIEEARDIIFENLPTCASNLMLADFRSGQVSVVEIDNCCAIFRDDQMCKGRGTYSVACANHFIRLEGAMTPNSYLRQYYLDSEAAKMTGANIDPVAKAMASPGILNDITVYSLVTDGMTVLEQIGDGIESDETRYEDSSLEI